MTPLHLEDDCVVLAGEHVLHVLNRRGAFDLKGRDIHRLHQRIGPFLGGTHDEATLLAALPPPHADAVRAYLARLREVGALRVVAPPPSPSRSASPSPVPVSGADELPTFPAGERRMSLRVADLSVHVSLDGWDEEAAREHAVSIAFVSPEEAGRVLVRARVRGWEGRWVCVAVDSADLPEDEVRRRAALARWLLRNELDARGAGSRVRAYRLDGASGTLERLVEVEGEAAWRTWEIPSALHLVRPAETEQLPLVVAEAAHPFFPLRLRGVGVSYGKVRDPLLRSAVARLLASDASPGDAPLVAPSAAGVWARAVERRAAARVGVEPPAWRETELLRDAERHPATRYLGRVMAIRASALPARVGRTPEGAWVYERGGRRGVSLLWAMALGELLLGEAWDEFHAPRLPGVEMPPAAWEHADFASP
ncbi:MAG TPA: hypothetical protein VFR81_08200, partial [Longimicrobium sp.]|nr:hypothetical protein [Longimicrobium sp.]